MCLFDAANCLSKRHHQHFRSRFDAVGEHCGLEDSATLCPKCSQRNSTEIALCDGENPLAVRANARRNHHNYLSPWKFAVENECLEYACTNYKLIVESFSHRLGQFLVSLPAPSI